METSELKLDLHDKIDHADNTQTKELYGIITNHLNSGTDEEDWLRLSDEQHAAFLKGLSEADAGLGSPLSKVNERLRNKYGIDG